MQESAGALLRLVDQVSTPTLLILAHNGPRGLGNRAHDIWGCDFRDEEGDWGDPDLEVAVARAVERGLRAVIVAGHRVWHTISDEVLYVNPARVPRIYAGSDAELRYHAVLALDGGEAKLEQVELRS
jgi:uncharacterized protein (TIGR04168 family)